MLAENFSHSLSYERILLKHELVQIFVMYNGDVELVKKSLESAINQTYPYKKIFVAILTTKNISEFLQSIGSMVSEIEFVDKSELPNKICSDEGSYIQFIIPGDILLPDKIKNCVEFMNSNWEPSIIFSDVVSSSNEHFPNEPNLSYIVDTASIAIGIQLFKVILPRHEFFKSWLTRGFFKQRAFSNRSLIQTSINLMNGSLKFELSSIAFLINVILNERVHFFKDKLVERSCESWTENDFEQFKNISQTILNQIMKR